MKSPVAFRITGMDCAEEVAVLKREVGPLVGGEGSLAFDILNGRMSVIAAPAGVSNAAIIKAVRNAGLDATLVTDALSSGDGEGSFWQRRRRLFLTSLSGTLIVGALAVEYLGPQIRTVSSSESDAPLALAKVFFAMASAAGVWLVLPKAIGAIRRLRPDMNLLMTVAVIGAIAIGEWLEAATVSFLFALSLLLESWSVGRARRAIAALLDLSPPMARVVGADGAVTEVEPNAVAVGSMLSVKPGERIPLDGRVVQGTSEVNQAPITGESVPIPKEPGSEVYAGTINGDGAIQVETTRPPSDTTLAKIIRMVGEAQSRRGPSEQWVEKFARIYTPIVMGMAVLFLIVPPLVVGADWSSWLYRSLVLLVIACPCALVISTPVSIVAGLASAARQGVLIKGGAFLEAPAHLKAIALDKTGTLTVGKPKVVEIVPLSGHDEKSLMERAAALERHSEHPIARAILAYAAEHTISPLPAEDFRIVQGRGAVATIDGRQFWVGSHRYLEERSQETQEMHLRLEKMAGAGRTVVVIGNESHVCGLIALADEIRPNSREILARLKEMGIQSLVMLTGDNRPTADAVGKAVGIDEIRAELLPQDKVDVIESLVATFDRVGMVGDGVNDAPALARASVGIAMGAAGTDVAIETADIALMSDNLDKLPWLIHHSRRTLNIIRQNIAFSLAVKAAFVVLTFAGAATLWSAIAADTGASLLVILNGLRLLRADTGSYGRSASS